MQRIHCWLDQLTMRRSRRSRDSSRRMASQSVAPSYRLNTEQPKKELKPVAVPIIIPPPLHKHDTGSFARRKGIRTNPWLYGGGEGSLRGSIRTNILPHRSFQKEPLSLDRRRPPPSLGVKSLDESTCSSGYGSQDCSPDSSVHMPPWQTEGLVEGEVIDEGCFLEDTSSFSTYDNVCDEHVYHELEFCTQPIDRAYSSELLFSPRPESRSLSPLYARPDSPIYAQPWTQYCPSNITRSPLVLHNQSFIRTPQERPPSPIYASPYSGPMARPYIEETPNIYPGSFCSQLSSPGHQSFHSSYIREQEEEVLEQFVVPKAIEQAEEEFLSELDAQIAELQLRSDELRSLVEKARVRRRTNWFRPLMECTFELVL